MIKLLFKPVTNYLNARAIKKEKEITLNHACVIAAGLANASVEFWGKTDKPELGGIAYDTEMIASASVAIVMAIERKVL